MKDLKNNQFEDIYNQYYLSDEDIWNLTHSSCIGMASIDRFDDKSKCIMNRFRELINMDEFMCKSIIENCPGILSNEVYNSAVNIHLLHNFNDFKNKFYAIKKEQQENDIIRLINVYAEGSSKSHSKDDMDIVEKASNDKVLMIARSDFKQKELLIDVNCYIYVPLHRVDILKSFSSTFLANLKISRRSCI